MKKLTLLTASLLLMPGPSFGFGGKNMKVTEITGVTEAQVNKTAEGDKAWVMVRGKAAELFFKMMKNQPAEKEKSQELAALAGKNTTEWNSAGKQVSCSKLENTKKKTTDYACAFELNIKGEVVAGTEPFSPAIFNLARTETKSHMFKKKNAGRAIASVGSQATYDKASAYVMYDKPEDKRHSENAMVVIRGNVAKEIIAFLQDGKNAQAFQMKGISGVKGAEISCVNATESEKERCAIVVSLADGSVSTNKNPLFR
jgi:hypothetical protein